MKVGLDLGTGFVKCVSDVGSVRFPTLYARRVGGCWSTKASEAVGSGALALLGTAGTAAVGPISKGRPDPRHQKQVEMLVREALAQIRCLAKAPAPGNEKLSMVVGLPYHAFDQREFVAKLVKRTLDADSCSVVAQACGTLVDLDMDTGVVVSIGQGTTEIVVVDGSEVIDGASSAWASDFVTKKVGRFAHLDPSALEAHKDVCKKYARVLAENLAAEIRDVAGQYGYPLALSGGGLLMPGVRDELEARLEGRKIVVPSDPVMSNARGLYKLAA